MARKEDGVVLTCDDLPEEPINVCKPLKKRRQMASVSQKIVQKPPKKKVVQQKKI